MTPFTFSLGDKVAITRSGESGRIEGRTEFLHYPANYFVIYTSADGRAVEGWFPEHELSAH